MAFGPMTQQPGFCDGVFRVLVAFVNKNKTEISVTLSMRGSVVTGMLVPSSKALPIMLTAVLGELDEDMRGSERDQESPVFFHMEGARFFNSGEALPSQGGFVFRGRIDEVSGFGIGELK